MAQLLCLESMDPDRDISIYINSPGGSYTAMTAIYDTMQFVKPEVQTVCLGQAASAAACSAGGGHGWQALCAAARPRPHPSALLRRWRTGLWIIEIQANEILRMRQEMEGILREEPEAGEEAYRRPPAYICDECIDPATRSSKKNWPTPTTSSSDELPKPG